MVTVAIFGQSAMTVASTNGGIWFCRSLHHSNNVNQIAYIPIDTSAVEQSENGIVILYDDEVVVFWEKLVGGFKIKMTVW